MNEQPSILIINTGGTIGMVIDSTSGALRPINFNNLFDLLPTLKLFNYQIDSYCFDPLIDSSNMNPEFWVQIAKVIQTHYEQYDGFVILHGSDTMAYTASVLSFMLQNLNKPVILTGSQLPLGMIRTDGRENLLTAVEIAAAKEDETPVVPEVCVYFENKLFRGNRTHKFNAQHFDAFHSFNYPPLARVGVHIDYSYEKIQKPNFKKLKVYLKLDTHPTVLRMFPGISKEVVQASLQIPGLKALILETYGSGNAMNEGWFIALLKEAIQKGLILLNVSQCQEGRVEMGKYETSVELMKMGMISGNDISIEAAIAKLMYLLGNLPDKDAVIKMLKKSIVGEMTISST